MDGEDEYYEDADDVNGVTLSYVFDFSNVNHGPFAFYPGVTNDDADVEYADTTFEPIAENRVADQTAAINFNFGSEPIAANRVADQTAAINLSSQTSVETLPTSITNTAQECYIFFSVVIIVLVITGIIANLSGYVLTAANYKKDRHYHNFLHIFVSNIYVLVPLAFTAAARLQGAWTFGNKSYKMLSVVFSLANTSCTFHLVYLAFIRCGEMRDQKIRSTKGWRKVICYFIWFAAIASAWPTAIYDDILWDVMKFEPTARSHGGALFIKVDTIISFILPGFLMTAFFLFACIATARAGQKQDRKTFRDYWNDVREICCIFILFFICWLPYRAWRIVSLQHATVSGCKIIPSLVLCFGATFSTIMPVLHLAFLCAKRKKRIDSISSEEGENLNPDSKTTALDEK